MKSGIEMIEELLDKVAILDRRFTVVEQNMKELLNRANGFMLNKPTLEVEPKPQIESAPQISGSSISGPSISGTAPSATSIEAMNAGVMKATTNTTKVLGKIKTKEGKSLIGAKITIVKENGEIVKETKTNKAGDWMSFLPVGKYKAKYFMDKIIDTDVSFTVDPSQTLIRVAQPKW